MSEKPVTRTSRKQRVQRVKNTVITLVVLAVLALVVVKGCIPFFETGGGERVTYPAPGGDDQRFDPIASIAAVQSTVGEGAELISIYSMHVKSDGTQDLTTDLYMAYTDYDFVRPIPAPEDAPPIGAGGSATGEWFQVSNVSVIKPGQWRRTTHSGGSYTYLHKGMSISLETPSGDKALTVELPRCSYVTLWEHALQEGVPEGAVAAIVYDAAGYRFTINDLGYNARFTPDCEAITN
jgi:hypothetical protein